MGVAKPVRESLWRGLSNEARYEAKPIVDTLANRWGGGSAAFMVAMINKLIMWVGAQEEDAGSGEGVDGSNGSGGFVAVTADVDILGFPPVIFLCLIVAVWWAVVSVDLGHVRKRIDLELKKRQ
uniref:Uncharacterized protein n=1 Tax=Craspedostauros australis TaxID=1486917 RepID=A0A7R9WRH8_9STRA